MEAEGAEDGGEVAFFAGGVDKAAGGEGGGVKGTEAGERYGEREDEAAEGTENFRAKCLCAGREG